MPLQTVRKLTTAIFAAGLFGCLVLSAAPALAQPAPPPPPPAPVDPVAPPPPPANPFAFPVPATPNQLASTAQPLPIPEGTPAGQNPTPYVGEPVFAPPTFNPVNGSIAGAAKPMPRTYVWPYQMHASLGPSCAVADWRDGQIRVWSGTQNPHVLRADLALLVERPESEIEVIRLEAAGCYGRNCADDVSADALLLSRAVGRPVRVQLTREQEHAWEPKGTAQLIDVNGGLNANGGVAAYDLATRYPSNGAPTLA